MILSHKIRFYAKSKSSTQSIGIVSFVNYSMMFTHHFCFACILLVCLYVCVCVCVQTKASIELAYNVFFFFFVQVSIGIKYWRGPNFKLISLFVSWRKRIVSFSLIAWFYYDTYLRVSKWRNFFKQKLNAKHL